MIVDGSHTTSLERARSDHSKRPIFVILGMHRSGTSLCSSVLSVLGVDMTDDIWRNRGNEAGHWERRDLVALQDEVLELLQRPYFSPYHDYPLPSAWWADPRLKPIESRIEALIAENLKVSKYFGFKDPRTVKLIPMWKRIFSTLNLAPKYIICLRNPYHVAKSLQTRDQLEPEIGEFRTLDYMVDCLRYGTEHPHCFIEYEDWFSAPYETAFRLQAFLDLDVRPQPADVRAALDGLIRAEMNREGPSGGQARQPLVRNFYNLVRKLKDDRSLAPEVGRFTDTFVAFRQLLPAFEIPLRRTQSDLGQLTHLPAEVAQITAAHVATATDLDALRAAHAALEQQSAGLLAMSAAQAAELEAVRASHAAREQAQEAELAHARHAAAEAQRSIDLLSGAAAELDACRVANAALEQFASQLQKAADDQASELAAARQAWAEADHHRMALQTAYDAKLAQLEAVLATQRASERDELETEEATPLSASALVEARSD